MKAKVILVISIFVSVLLQPAGAEGIEDLQLSGDSTSLMLSWNSETGGIYRVLGCPDMIRGSWDPISEDLVATRSATTWSTNVIDPKYYYRLQMKTAAGYTNMDDVVGYHIEDIGHSPFRIYSYPYEGNNMSPGDVYGDQLPLGTRIYTFTGQHYQISQYAEVFNLNTFEFADAWYPNDLNLAGATGFWVEYPPGPQASVFICGKVPMDMHATNTIVKGFQLISCPYPVSTSVSDLEIEQSASWLASLGEKIYTFNGSSYSISEYQMYFDLHLFVEFPAWNPPLSINFGEGFWYESHYKAREWISSRPYGHWF